MTTDLEKIETILAQSSSTDIPVLIKAKEDAKRLVREDASAGNLAALDRVTRMLREARLTMEGHEGFTKVKDVLVYLQTQGRKISQSQLYKDIGAGYLVRQKDSSFRRSDLDRYAQKLPMVVLPEKSTSDLASVALEGEREKLAMNRSKRLKLDLDRHITLGKYVQREEVAAELAARATTLALGLRATFELFAVHMIEMTGGDTNRIADVVSLFERNLDAALNEYSRPMDFSVTLLPNEHSGAEATDDDDEEQTEES